MREMKVILGQAILGEGGGGGGGEIKRTFSESWLGKYSWFSFDSLIINKMLDDFPSVIPGNLPQIEIATVEI